MTGSPSRKASRRAEPDTDAGRLVLRLPDYTDTLRDIPTCRLPADATPGVVAYVPWRSPHGDDGHRLCRIERLSDQYATIRLSDGRRWRCVDRVSLRVPLLGGAN